MAFEKIEILGAVLELPAKQHCQFSPFGPIFEVNGLDWQCYLAGSSKTAPRILIFSIAMVADYSFDVKNIEIWAPAFFKHNNSFIATVYRAIVHAHGHCIHVLAEFARGATSLHLAYRARSGKHFTQTSK